MSKDYDLRCDPKSYPPIDILGVDANTVTREELIRLHNYWEPRGSGNLFAGKIACMAIHLIVQLRGFAPLTYEEIKKARESRSAL